MPNQGTSATVSTPELTDDTSDADDTGSAASSEGSDDNYLWRSDESETEDEQTSSAPDFDGFETKLEAKDRYKTGTQPRRRRVRGGRCTLPIPTHVYAADKASRERAISNSNWLSTRCSVLYQTRICNDCSQ